jgi:hypothetical protein
MPPGPAPRAYTFPRARARTKTSCVGPRCRGQTLTIGGGYPRGASGLVGASRCGAGEAAVLARGAGRVLSVETAAVEVLFLASRVSQRRRVADLTFRWRSKIRTAEDRPGLGSLLNRRPAVRTNERDWRHRPVARAARERRRATAPPVGRKFWRHAASTLWAARLRTARVGADWRQSVSGHPMRARLRRPPIALRPARRSGRQRRRAAAARCRGTLTTRHRARSES